MDYWDYLGWKDPFGSKAFSDRQRRYKKARGLKQIWTPHFFINNASTRTRNLDAAVAGEPKVKSRLKVAAKATLRDGRIEVELKLEKRDARYEPDADAVVLLVPLLGAATTKCTAGENRGRTLEEFFIALGLHEGPALPAALEKGVKAKLEIPKDTKPENLSIAILIENPARMTTLECWSTPVTKN